MSRRWQAYRACRLVVFMIVPWLNKRNVLLCAECLEAEFYSFAAFGYGLNATLRGGGPAPVGGRKALLTPAAQTLAMDIATDETTHVAFLRSILRSVNAEIPCPSINIGTAFAAAANAALNTTLTTPFTPYAFASHLTHARP